MHHDTIMFIPKFQNWLNLLKSINRVYHIIKIKKNAYIYFNKFRSSTSIHDFMKYYKNY